MNDDLQYIKILSIFYYVIAGLVALLSCFALLYLFAGIMLLNLPPMENQPPPPAALGWLFIILSSAVFLLGWLWAAALVLAGWNLSKCRHYFYCMVLGCSILLFVPLGTVLGVFTIIVLFRPNAKLLFETGGQTDHATEAEEAEDYDDHIRRDSYNIRR